MPAVPPVRMRDRFVTEPENTETEGAKSARARRTRRLRLSAAFGIVILSILAATMAWRASVESERSANTDELARQDIVQRQQLLASQSQAVNQDLRVFGRFEERSLLARELDRDAKAGGGPDLAREAQEQRAQADSLRQFFRASQPTDNDDGTVAYDPEFARKILASDPELEVLRPEALREEARVANIKSVRLTGLAALFVAGLFFLTLAEVTRGAVARGLTGTAALLAVSGGVLFFLL